MKKKTVFSWSGGKDSALALYKLLQSNEYEVISLLTTLNSRNRRSFMHGIPPELLEEQAGSIGLPLYLAVYAPEEEINDYENCMRDAVDYFKTQGVTHFAFGDIFLHDVRLYREEKLKPCGIEVVEPLWDMKPADVMDEFLRSGLKTVVVTTMADLLGEEYIGRIVDRAFADSLPGAVDVLGENGEYHTFCFDGPVFSRPVRYALGEPFRFSHTVNMGGGTRRTFTYWAAHPDTEGTLCE